jgi:hypothetical protein
VWSKGFGWDSLAGGFRTTVAVDPRPLASGGGDVVVGGGSVDSSVPWWEGRLIRYSSTGAVEVNIGTGSLEEFPHHQITDVAVDAAGNMYATGTFRGQMSLGGTPLTSAGVEDAFLYKLDSAGTSAWSKKLGDGSSQYGQSVVVSPTGKVIACGDFKGSINPGAPKTSAGDTDVFLVSYTSGGAFEWVQSFGDVAKQTCRGLAVDSSGNLYLTGFFLGTVNFGGGPLTSAGAEDIFIAKLDSTGNHIWSRSFGDAAIQYGQGVAAGLAGEAYLAAEVQGTFDLGGAPLTSAGAFDALVAGFTGFAP